jgi:uncharacterized membrane protein YdjX (TVP38/TMEM64 family)
MPVCAMNPYAGSQAIEQNMSEASKAAGTAEIATGLTGRARPGGGLRLKIVALAVIFVGGIALFRWTPLAGYADPQAIADFFRGLGTPWWSPLVFVPLYAFSVAFGMPGTIPTLAGGAIFGVARGMLFNTIAANLGAFLAFLLARYLGRDFVSRTLKGRAATLDQRIGEHGFGTILYLRLIPLVPFNALNFAAGISRISLRDYLIGTLIGMLPGTLVYTYFADALIRGSGEARREAFLHFFVAAALLVVFTVITGWIRRRRGDAFAGVEEEPE